MIWYWVTRVFRTRNGQSGESVARSSDSWAARGHGVIRLFGSARSLRRRGGRWAVSLVSCRVVRVHSYGDRPGRSGQEGLFLTLLRQSLHPSDTIISVVPFCIRMHSPTNVLVRHSWGIFVRKVFIAWTAEWPIIMQKTVLDRWEPTGLPDPVDFLKNKVSTTKRLSLSKLKRFFFQSLEV